MIEYEYETQVLTSYGWECVDTNATRADAIASRDCYRLNDANNAYRYKRVRG